MKAILVHAHGGAEAMKLEEVAIPQPGAGQALVKLAASGVNFIDVYFRVGLYKADLPAGLGMEGAGTVEAVGEGVTEVKPGDRVTYAMTRGSYAEYAVVPAWQLVPVPEGMSLETAAAAMLQGMTAHYLTHSSFALKAGDWALVHAAAGGAGRLTASMARMLGAHVIGTASSSKHDVARAAGCEFVIDYNTEDFEVETRRITEGRGVDVVYDSVGRTTFLKGLNVLRRRGTMVSFGQASGAVEPFDPLLLNQKGSLFLTRPSLFHHCATREELMWRATDVLNWIAAGKIELLIDRTYPLADAAEAHRDLEGRKTVGKLLLKM